MKKFYKSMYVDYDPYYGKYCVFAYDSNGDITILSQHTNQSSADDYADNFAINNNMFYDHNKHCYYNKKYKIHY